MLRAARLLCLPALFLGLLAAVPALAADYEDIFLANTLVARLRDPGKFATLGERAAKVDSLLIEVLSSQDTMHPKVTVKEESGTWTVYSGSLRVLSVLPKDAAGSGMPAKALAQTWANNLKKLLPLATPPSRMGSAAPKPPAAAPPAGTGPGAATVPAGTKPAGTAPAATTPAPGAGAPLSRQAALVVLLDSLNQARALPDDQYLLKREDLANQVLNKLQAFLAGQPALPPPVIAPPPTTETPTTPPTTETPTTPPGSETPATPAATRETPSEPVPGLPQVTPLPADLAKLPVQQRVVKKFELAAGPYQALRNTNPPLYAQVGSLLAEARSAKAAFKWEEAEGFLDGALAMLGFKVGQ
jgi:hypothetical protein